MCVHNFARVSGLHTYVHLRSAAFVDTCRRQTFESLMFAAFQFSTCPFKFPYRHTTRNSEPGNFFRGCVSKARGYGDTIFLNSFISFINYVFHFG